MGKLKNIKLPRISTMFFPMFESRNTCDCYDCNPNSYRSAFPHERVFRPASSYTQRKPRRPAPQRSTFDLQNSKEVLSKPSEHLRKGEHRPSIFSEHKKHPNTRNLDSRTISRKFKPTNSTSTRISSSKKGSKIPIKNFEFRYNT